MLEMLVKLLQHLAELYQTNPSVLINNNDDRQLLSVVSVV